MLPAANQNTTSVATPLDAVVGATRRSTNQERYTTELSNNDVLLGRGVPIFNHPGNTRFRQIVQGFKGRYTEASKHQDKNDITQEIIHVIEQTYNGRFLREVKTSDEARSLGIERGTKAWSIVSEADKIKKVKQTLRDPLLLQASDNDAGHQQDDEEVREDGKQQPLSSNRLDAQSTPTDSTLPINNTSTGNSALDFIAEAALEGQRRSLFLESFLNQEQRFQLQRQRELELMLLSQSGNTPFAMNNDSAIMAAVRRGQPQHQRYASQLLAQEQLNLLTSMRRRQQEQSLLQTHNLSSGVPSSTIRDTYSRFGPRSDASVASNSDTHALLFGLANDRQGRVAERMHHNETLSNLTSSPSHLQRYIPQTLHNQSHEQQIHSIYGRSLAPTLPSIQSELERARRRYNTLLQANSSTIQHQQDSSSLLNPLLFLPRRQSMPQNRIVEDSTVENSLAQQPVSSTVQDNNRLLPSNMSERVLSNMFARGGVGSIRNSTMDEFSFQQQQQQQNQRQNMMSLQNQQQFLQPQQLEAKVVAEKKNNSDRPSSASSELKRKSSPIDVDNTSDRDEIDAKLPSKKLK